MDEFAQTRGADDLFDDEIIPISAEQQAEAEVTAPVEDSKPVEKPTPAENLPSPRAETPRSHTSERGRGRGRGRGKTGGQGGGRGLQESRWAAKPAENKPKQKPKTKSPAPPTEPVGDEEDRGSEGSDQTHKTPNKDKTKGEAVPATGSPESQRMTAVRGDRSATGGIRKPKLTEEELSKRIANAKENAVKKAAAHARAEADQASFIEREQVAAKKRREELARRRIMDNEREKNRQRKLKAQTGREWDSQKQEEDYNPRGTGSQFRRGMHGGVSGHTRRDFEDGQSEGTAIQSSPGRGRGRGRGGRGRGSKEPGEKRVNLNANKKSTPAVNDEADFPSLPATEKPTTEKEKVDVVTKPSPPSMETLEATMSPVTGTWADQFDD